jgi:hypothetical protein
LEKTPHIPHTPYWQARQFGTVPWGASTRTTRFIHMSSESTPSSEFVVTDRRNGDRRQQGASDRRKRSIPVAVERRAGKERRERGERRRQVDPTTCEKDYNDDEIIFMKAMDQYKRANRRPFPTWSEVLEVLRSLGYRRTEEATVLPGLPSVPAVEE